LFEETMTFPNQVLVPWKTNGLTVVFYGSSHLREMYFTFVKLARGLSYNSNNVKELGEAVTNVGSGFPDTDGNRSLCDPNRTGYVQGAYGVDLVKENAGLLISLCGGAAVEKVRRKWPASIDVQSHVLLKTES
jgi:hypothetical protein